MTPPDPLVEVLREVVVLLRGLRTDMALARKQSAPEAVGREDGLILARLLPAITGALGSESFASRDLKTSSAPGLRLVVRDRSAKSIGKLLARAEGIPIGGLLVERVGVEINVTLWRVVASVSNRFESGTGLAQSEKLSAGVT